MNIGSSGKNSQDFELNIASIIDCFTVLIAFMLATAAFLSVGLLDAGVAAAGSEAKSDTPPPVNIQVELDPSRNLTLKLSGKESGTSVIKAGADGWNYAELSQRLGALKGKWPTVSAVTLTADNNVEYKDVVKTMEIIRKTQPVVMLGGF